MKIVENLNTDVQNGAYYVGKVDLRFTNHVKNIKI